jgi:hypothetical protein
MNITPKVLRDIAKQLENSKEKVGKMVKPIEGLPFKIGLSYFFRTVTYHLTGRVKAVIGKFLVLEEAAWIADSGRFNEFIKGTPSNTLEVEPFHDHEVYLNIDSITDATEQRIFTEVK